MLKGAHRALWPLQDGIDLDATVGARKTGIESLPRCALAVAAAATTTAVAAFGLKLWWERWAREYHRPSQTLRGIPSFDRPRYSAYLII